MASSGPRPDQLQPGAANIGDVIAVGNDGKPSFVSPASLVGTALDLVITTTKGLNNITLFGEQMLNGVLTNASRVLVVEQAAPADNGIYVTAAGAWVRASDADTSINRGATVYVSNSGASNNLSQFFLTTQVDIVGTDAQEWTESPAASGPHAPVVTTSKGLGNISTAGEQTLNDKLTSTSRVLLVEQTTTSQNGIWVTDAGSWSRPQGMDLNDVLKAGESVLVNDAASSFNGALFVLAVDVQSVQVDAQSWVEVIAPPVVPADHATRHENTGDDEINVTDLSGELADDQKPGTTTTMSYTPADLADWGGTTPATLKAALDFLASNAKPPSLLGPGSFYYPTTLSGIAVWLRADLGVTLGTGTNVVSWVDQISGNNFANAADDTTCPTFLASAIVTSTPDRPAIRFTKANSQWLEATDASKYPGSNDIPISFAVVLRPKDITIVSGNIQVICGIGAGNTVSGNAGVSFGSWGHTGPKFGAYLATISSAAAQTDTISSATDGNALNIWNANRGRVMAGVSHVEIDSGGLHGGAAAQQDVTSQTWDSFTLGKHIYNQVSLYYSDHDIAELMIFDNYMSDADWALIKQHIESFYAFTLPSPV